MRGWRTASSSSIVVTMALSARNQLRGQVKDVKLGDVMAHITVQVGDNEIESVITRTSADEMKLKAGDAVTVVIKSTEVMIQK
jgi:molybdopterin-binding protein